MFSMVFHNRIAYSGPFMFGCNPRANFYMGMALATSGLPTYVPMGYIPMCSGSSCSQIYPSFNSASSNYNYSQTATNPNLNSNYTFSYDASTGLYSNLYSGVGLSQTSTLPLINFSMPKLSMPFINFPSSTVQSQGAVSGASVSDVNYNKNALPSIKNSDLMKNVPNDRKERILAAVESACNKYNVDPKLVISMMYAESKFDPNATSRCGAAGLMQLMPGTASQYGASDPYNIEQNIDAAVKFIKYLKERYNGNMDLVVAAYNAGPARVQSSVPDIAETKTYVATVNRAYRSLS